MHPRRDAERKASLPRPRLSVPTPLHSRGLRADRDLSADHHQLTLILGVLGTPTLEDFYAIGSQRSRDYLRALPYQVKKPLQSLYPNANPLAIDLLERCLAFNPKKRISVVDALSHRTHLSPSDSKSCELTHSAQRTSSPITTRTTSLPRPFSLPHSSPSTSSNSVASSSRVSSLALDTVASR